MTELHFTKKDFSINWFSGTGAGGQYRNKHQNCCRITHIATGLRVQETRHRERSANQKAAFRKLAQLLVSYFADQPEGRRSQTEVVRNYHGVRNEVLDKASGLRLPYESIMHGNGIGEMIEARRDAIVRVR